MTRSPTPIFILALLAALHVALPARAEADAPKPAPSAAAERGDPPSRAASTTPPNPLPPPATTSHELRLADRTLQFKAIAGAIRLSDGSSGNPLADVGYTAFLLGGPDAKHRPVTFAINGGPGAASAWLDLGALGPWRIPMTGLVSPAQETILDNNETWLDFTDLVFIDPPGTGYSRILAKGDDARKSFYSVGGDIDALSTVMRKWLAANGRLDSPKFIAGESYGGFRGPKLARRLQDVDGVGIQGMILISPVFDFDWFEAPNNPLTWVSRLPSLVAAAHNMSGLDGRTALRDVEAYAVGDYLHDLLAGERDPAAIKRVADKVAALTGLDPAFVARLGGRVDMSSFARERGRAEGKVASLYDARILGFDPSPHAASSEHSDPVLDALKTPLAGAMADITANRLNWPVDARYEILSRSVSRQWDWSSGETTGAESLGDLKRALAADPTMRVLVVHGLTDQVTPYFASKLLMDQVPAMGDPNRLRLAVYGGGHMVYAEDQSRAALRADARRLIEGK